MRFVIGVGDCGEELLDIGRNARRTDAYPVVSLLVVQPDEQELLVDELGALDVDDVLEELLTLQQLEQRQTLRIGEVLAVGRRGTCSRPVRQVLQVVEERVLAKVAALRQVVQIVRIGQQLHELELDLKAFAVVLLVEELVVDARARRRRSTILNRCAGRSWCVLLLLMMMMVMLVGRAERHCRVKRADDDRATRRLV